MSQRPLPPQYRSSERVLDGISSAFSTLYNPRGLECLWNSPYCQTFYELVHSYQDEKFLIYSPYTLWMPALIKKEQKLRKTFEEYGLDYDVVPARLTRTTLKTTALKVERYRQQLFPNTTKAPNASSLRKSERNEKKNQEDIVTKQKKLEHKVQELFDRRLELLEKQNEHSKRTQSDSNIHDASIASIEDITSFEKEPDIFVTHVATVKLPKPKSQTRRIRHELRAGRKIYHQCGAVIIELKQGPSRLIIEKYKMKASSHIKKAQDQLLLYCSAYFACYPDAMSIVAIATGGQYWKWANIQRSQTPEWNYVEGCVDEHNPKNTILIEEWSELFSRILVLGTQGSDKMLSEINEKYIYTLLDHTPEIPAHLLVEEDDDNEDDQEGKEEENEAEDEYKDDEDEEEGN